MTFDSAPQANSEGSKGEVDFDAIFADAAKRFEGHKSPEHNVADFDPSKTGEFELDKIERRGDQKLN